MKEILAQKRLPVSATKGCHRKGCYRKAVCTTKPIFGPPARLCAPCMRLLASLYRDEALYKDEAHKK